VFPSGRAQDYNYGFGLGTSDNGNVASMTATGTQNFSRSFTYDAVNRLSAMSDTNTSQTCRGLSWNYDVWGNRTDQNVTGRVAAVSRGLGFAFARGGGWPQFRRGLGLAFVPGAPCSSRTGERGLPRFCS
jgi:hypothetical protein